jgi:hypothetical protein
VIAIDERSLTALLCAAGLKLHRDDIELLTRSLRRYADITAKLERANLDGTEMPAGNDPRAGW